MEDAFIIHGGKKLEGNISLSGAKNSSLKMVIAALLFDEEVRLFNVPAISDVVELLQLIETLGGTAKFIEKNTVLIDGREISKNKVDLLHGSKIRVSFMLAAPLLKKFGFCSIPNPGGCRIGARPIDRIIAGVTALGIDSKYDSETGYYELKMNKKPKGKYSFTKPSHTGTELLIMFGLFSEETIIIENAALEPEIDELIDFLNKSGARIKRENKNIFIEPYKNLKPVPFTIMPDRNEAVTFATLALTTRGDITISKTNPKLLESFTKKTQEANGGYEKLDSETIRFYYKKPLKAVSIETAPHPGFMTDWQPNWAVLMTQAEGSTTICERVFENRFMYVSELRRLGAEIDYVKIPVTNPGEYFFFNFDPAKKYNQAIRILGKQTLHSGVLNVTDLRAGATLAIAALTADDPEESVVYGASILDRGYENFVEKIKSLGGDIERI